MKRYRIKYKFRIMEDVGMHILRWLGLSVCTLGIALLF